MELCHLKLELVGCNSGLPYRVTTMLRFHCIILACNSIVNLHLIQATSVDTAQGVLACCILTASLPSLLIVSILGNQVYLNSISCEQS